MQVLNEDLCATFPEWYPGMDSDRPEGKLQRSPRYGKVSNLSYRLGRTVHFDPVTWSCAGDEEATAQFMRNYRAPFIVPKLA